MLGGGGGGGGKLSLGGGNPRVPPLLYQTLEGIDRQEGRHFFDHAVFSLCKCAWYWSGGASRDAQADIGADEMAG